MNVVVLIGRLTSDVSLNESGKTPVASFRLAVDKNTQDKGADFIQCKAFGKTAINVHEYKHKGDEVAVNGRISTGSYTNKEGKTVYTTDVICNNVEFTHGSKGNTSDKYTDSRVKSLVDEDIPDSFEQLDEDVPF